MKGKTKVSAIFAILLLIINVFVVVQLPLSVVANPGESVDVSFPSYSWEYPDHKPGDTVVMELKIENSTPTQEPVKSFQADFSFDPAILYCIDVKEGLFLKGPYLNWSTTFTNGTINNTAGTVTGVNGTITEAGKNATAGFGVLAYVWFTVLRCGSSIIDLTDCDVVKPDLSAISVTLVDGYFELGVKVSLASYSWGYPDHKPGDVVVVELKIEAPEAADWTHGVISWEADFSFDPKILQALNVYNGTYLAGPYLNWTNTLTVGGIDNNAGTITDVNGTLLEAGKNAAGSGILAYLVFSVVGAGSTVINITDCTVLDVDSLSIPLILVVGYFELGVKVSLPTVNWWYPDHKPGDAVVMELKIEAPEATDWVGGVVSWQANFSFDPTILQCTNVYNGTYLAGPYLNWTNTLTVANINNTAGTITDVNGTLLEAGKHATGSGILAYLVFSVVGVGSTDITITDCTVLVSDPYEVPLTLVDGHFGLGITLSLPNYEWRYGEHNIGDVVVMELKIDTPELFAWQAGFSYDPTVLDLLNIMEGPYLKGPYLNWSTTFTTGTINHTTGEVTPYGCTIKGDHTASGSGILAYLVFNVTGVGSTEVELTDVILKDPDLHDVPPTLLVGYFELGLEVSLPTYEWVYPDHNPGDVVVMELRTDSPELYAWQAGFSFNPYVLQCLDVVEGPYLKSAGTTLWIPGTINNTKGEVTAYSCTLLGDDEASGSGILAYLVFNVTGVGSTEVELTDADLDPTEVILKDLDLHDIPLTIVDGQLDFAVKVEIGSDIIWRYPEHDIGETFWTNLTIITPELHSWQGGFRYDPDVLECLQITRGEYPAGPGQWIAGTINNTIGEVTASSFSRFGSTNDGPTGPDGAVLMHIQFNITGAGSTAIELTDLDLDLTEVKLYRVEDGSLIEILPVLVDGYFELGAMVDLVPRVEYTYPAQDIGTIFPMSLRIKTPTLFAWQAGFSFDPDVLQCLNVTEGPYLQTYGTTVEMPGEINNTIGVITPYGYTLTGDDIADETGSGGAVLAILWFNVTSPGNSTIEITDCELYSSEIPATVTDGYFELAAEMYLEVVATSPIVWHWDMAAGSPDSGHYLEVKIKIKTPTLFSWQAGFAMSNELQIADASEGPYLQGFGTTEWFEGTVDNVYVIGCTLLGGVTAGPTGPDGALLATIYVISPEPPVPGNITLNIVGAQAYSSIIPVNTVSVLCGEFRQWGDADGNGEINILDVKKTKNVYNVIIPWTKSAWADIDSNGVINILDVKKMKQIYGGYLHIP